MLSLKRVRASSMNDGIQQRRRRVECLARAFGDPRRWPDELGASIVEAFTPLSDKARAAALAFRQAFDNEPDRTELAARHTRLFIGPFRPEVAPYASAWLEPDHMPMGNVSAQALEAYREAGLDFTNRSEPPDHLVAELEFLLFLVVQQHSSGDLRWRHWQLDFYRQCLQPWIGGFCRALAEANSDHSLYRALAVLCAELGGDFDINHIEDLKPGEDSAKASDRKECGIA